MAEESGQGRNSPFADYEVRPAPVEGQFVSMASEIAALLNRHALEKAQMETLHQKELRSTQCFVGRATQLTYHLERALIDSHETFKSVGLERMFKRLRIIKDQLKDLLASEGFTWRDPQGEQFTEELASMVDVDGWRYSNRFDEEIVDETREPIILLEHEVLLTGIVVVGAPES